MKRAQQIIVFLKYLYEKENLKNTAKEAMKCDILGIFAEKNKSPSDCEITDSFLFGLIKLLGESVVVGRH